MLGAEMDCINAFEDAALWRISGRMINYYCVDGYIPDVQKLSAIWIIPKDAPEPEDRRRTEDRKTDSMGGRSDAKTKDI